MFNCVSSLLFGGLLLGFVMPGTSQDKDMTSALALSDGSNKFAMSLYQALSKNSTENVIVSPISIQFLLALSYMGARGRTASEIKTALGLPDNVEDILNGHKSLIEGLKSPVLKLATKMFLEKTFTVKDEFQAVARNYFLSTAEQVDFKGEPDLSRQKINQWVEENTNQKIKDLLADGTIDTMTRLVLVNAVHFKAKWKHQFVAADTEDAPFYITPTQTVTVKMMHLKEYFGYKQHTELGAKILELPYDGDQFRMVIILPDKKDGLAEVEGKLQKMNLVHEFADLAQVKVNVALPRFKIEKTMDLNDILISMGLSSMFTNADFTGITEDEPLVVSKAVQKAFIEVNEEGTEAAAATALVFRTRSLLVPREKIFVADHPFIYILQNIAVPNNILFFGRLALQ